MRWSIADDGFTSHQGTVADGCTIRNCDFQIFAIPEGIFSNGFYAWRNFDRLQICAISESRIANMCDAAWDGDVDQMLMTVKCIVGNDSDMVGNDDESIFFGILIQYISYDDHTVFICHGRTARKCFHADIGDTYRDIDGF